MYSYLLLLLMSIFVFSGASMPAAQYYGVLCVIDFVQILPVHQAAPHGRGRVTFKGGTSNYTLPAAGLFLLPLWVRQCTGLSARADSDEFHGWLVFRG
jgi:hypothetical protein